MAYLKLTLPFWSGNCWKAVQPLIRLKILLQKISVPRCFPDVGILTGAFRPRHKCLIQINSALMIFSFS